MITHIPELTPQEDDENVYLPSAARIARMCAVMRRNWSERELQKRSVAERPVRWTAPEVAVRLDTSKQLID